ncbi:MAG: protein-disulfide reductase DsbD domain-containing protein, partial [Betaproteobacteria bacterium]
MKLHALLLAFAALQALAADAAAQDAAVVTTPQVRAELVAHAPEGLQGAKAAWLGLKIEHKPHWHTYWKNPGDSGLPTRFEWTLAAGLAPGDIDWPAPKRLPLGPLMNYGYEGTVLLPVTVQVPAGFA